MFLGAETDLPIDLLYPPPPVDSDDRSTNEYVAELKYRLKTVQEMARNSLMEEAGQKQKLAYDRKVSKHTYKVGDAVWLICQAKRLM